jgi:hypothetical protein
MGDAAWHRHLFEQPGLAPFFTALGWDVGNKVSFAEAYKDAIRFSITTHKSPHDGLVRPVERMLALHHQQSTARTPLEKTILERQIAALDSEIDSLV